MSIFKKDCPECAASNSVEAVRCSCGYCFDPDALAGADADAYADEQNRLYQDYLGARIVQAEAELTVAREQAKADPTNTYQAAAALVAEQALNALHAEIKQLTMRLTAKRPTGMATRSPTAPRPPVVETKSMLTSAVAPAPAEMPAPRSAARVIAPASRPDRVSVAHKPNAQAPLPPLVAKTTPQTTTKLEANKAGDIHAPAARNVTAPPTARSATPRSEPPRAQHSAKPGANFRKVQARKADAIAKSQAIGPVTKVRHALASVVSALTTPPAPAAASPRASAQNATRECPSCTATVASELEKCRCGYTFSKAAEEMPAVSLAVLKTASKDATQECPSCTTSVPVSRERCNCGYTFAKSTEHVPALTLDAAALAILTEGIKPNNASRRR